MWSRAAMGCSPTDLRKPTVSSRTRKENHMTRPPKTSAQENPMDDETPKPKLELVPPTEEELDEEEKEFRALRRDLPGVKGASAIGIVAIGVGKTPGRHEFFRTHAEFRPVVPIVDL